MHIRELIILTSLIAICGCNGKDGDTGIDDTANDTTEESDTGTAPVYAEAQFFFAEYPIGGSMAGIDIISGDQITTTDADGAVFLDIELWSPYEVIATADGYHDTNLYGYNDDEDFVFSSLMISHTTSAQIYNAVGLTHDPADSIVVVSIFTPGGYLPGVTVSLDAPYDFELAADSSQPMGFSPGNTTLQGSPGWIVFMDVEEGDVNTSITPPDGYTCTVFPGKEVGMTFSSVPDAVINLSYDCVPE